MTEEASNQDFSTHLPREASQPRRQAVSGYRIRTLLLVLIAFHMFALVAGLTFMTFRQYQDEVAEQQNLATSARVFSVHETEGFIEQSEALLSKLAAYPAIQALDVNNCDRLLSELQYLSYIYANLITLNRDGQLVCSEIHTARYAARAGSEIFFYRGCAHERIHDWKAGCRFCDRRLGIGSGLPHP